MSSNAAVIAAILGHHRQLSDELRVRTAAVLASAHGSGVEPARDELCDWYRAELVPHAVAEEKTLYDAAAQLPATRLLVRAMLAEHEALLALIAELTAAPTALEIATSAASAQALFATHLVKENDLLLPALDEAGTDLGTLLADMHELIGAPDQAEESSCGCGGCGCGDGGEAGTVDVSLTGAAAAGELDVRALPHGSRHEIIFDMLDALAPGETLTIVNDHDPKPLRYQTAAIWPDRFEWTYRDTGPLLWRVVISRVG